MRIQYDREVDALYIQVRDVEPDHVVDIPGTFGFSADVDSSGSLVGIEILQATKLLGADLKSLTIEDLNLVDEPA